MARASTATLLSLDRFAQLSGLHPLHFNQVYVEDLAPTEQCDSTLLQYSWQMNDGVSREEIALAIAEAEADLETFLRFAPAPKYYDEIVQPQGYYRGGFLSNNYLCDLSRGYVLTGGVRATSALGTNQTITYSDADSDSYKETATVTVSNVTCSADEVKVYYPGKDPADETWEIRPINVSISGTIATITFKREQAVHPSKLDAYNAEPVDGLIDANFLDKVDVYRVYTDTSIQSSLISRTSPCLYGCDNYDCTDCTWEETTGCIRVINSRLGQVHASPTEDAYCRDWPSKVQVRYLAGLNLEGNTGAKKIRTKYELAIARLAMTKLDRPMCSCESIQGNFAYWTTDLASVVSDSSGSNIRQVAPSTLECPFGTMRAGVWAYNIIKDERLLVTGANLG